MTSPKFAHYMRWLKYIHDDHPKLDKGISRTTLLAFCQALARSGTLGIDCFKSNRVIAEELEIIHREKLTAYRRFAVSVGWFVENGKRHGRVMGLDIAIPAEDSQVSTEVISNERQPVTHDQALRWWDCPPRQEIVEERRQTVGRMDAAEIAAIHAKG